MTMKPPPNNTVNINDRDLIKLCAKLNPTAKPISIPIIDKPRPIGNCYWNAWAQVQEHGGKIVYGWLFTEWPNVFITAMHHAVWQNKHGEIFDVSAKYDSDVIKDRTTFLPDDSIQIDLQKLPNICSHIVAMDNLSPRVSHCFFSMKKAYEMRNIFERRNSDILYKTGYRCEEQFEKAITGKTSNKPIPNVDIADQEDFQFSSNMKNIYNDAYAVSLSYLNHLTLMQSYK